MMKVFYDSYNVNSSISNFTSVIEQSERIVEQFSLTRLEGLKSIFNLANIDIEKYIDTLNKQPSSNEIRHKEYLIRQLSKSYLFHVNKFLNSKENSEYESFHNSIEIYKLLTNEIKDLNNLVLQKNNKIFYNNKELLNKISILIIGFFITYTILVIYLLRLYINDITRPLKDISDIAEHISLKNFDIEPLNCTSKDEIGNICRAFDKMTSSIKEYINTIWDNANKQMRLENDKIKAQNLYLEAKLQSLQTQINPHFLFNVLNSAAILSLQEEASRTGEFIQKLASLYRYYLATGLKPVTLKEELNFTDLFIDIMKTRFGNRLIINKDISTQYLQTKLPSMLVQPIVENCIKHGIKNNKAIVNLIVKDSENHIEITVTDNGPGFNDEIKNKILELTNTDLPVNEYLYNFQERNQENTYTKDNNSNGIGLINVILRLKLTFKENNLFEITNNEDQGAKFILRIPKNKELKKDV